MSLKPGLRIVRVHSSILNQRSQPQLITPLFSTPKQPRPTTQRRAASTASQEKEAVKSASEIISAGRPASPLPASSTLNPPASTRPPPLDLPTRDPQASLFRHLFRVGKAYTSFYKAGIGAIFTNQRLLARSTAATPSRSMSASTFPSRSDVLLRARVRHDLARLPVFGLLVLVCGEFTPLIVLVFPRLTPYTCRIPKQSEALRRTAEARRAASFRALQYHDVYGMRRLANGHICRSLGLTSGLWDKIGLDSPFASMLAGRAVARIAADDAMIRDGGGVGVLVDDEVVLACEDRGIDVRGESVDSLRKKLEEWIRKTAPKSRGGDVALKEAEEKVSAALLGLD
ncbi:hypothetical protein M426DRAFT_12749 [Hypoxylon sp. CI-4A]|nr:hypothetical protein M426DRAFT_12749 [Hypoxylon sp. CI-4A]